MSMKITATERIKASVEKVFEVFSDVKKSAVHISGIEQVKVVSDTKKGKGLRWRETRTMMGKQATEEMEITEMSPPNSYIVEASSHGMHYTTRFFFDNKGENRTDVTWEFYAKPTTIITKLTSPIFYVVFKRMTTKALKQDMLDLKKYIEEQERAT